MHILDSKGLTVPSADYDAAIGFYVRYLRLRFDFSEASNGVHAAVLAGCAGTVLVITEREPDRWYPGRVTVGSDDVKADYQRIAKGIKGINGFRIGLGPLAGTVRITGRDPWQNSVTLWRGPTTR